jgi:hypothetical protein
LRLNIAAEEGNVAGVYIEFEAYVEKQLHLLLLALEEILDGLANTQRNKGFNQQ